MSISFFCLFPCGSAAHVYFLFLIYYNTFLDICQYFFRKKLKKLRVGGETVRAVSVKRKRQVLADLAAGATMTYVSKKYHMSRNTVKKIKEDSGDEFQRAVGAAQKKATLSMAEWVTSRAERAQEIVQTVLDSFSVDEIMAMSGRDRAGLLKIMLEQFSIHALAGERESDVLNELLGKLDAAAGAPTSEEGEGKT